MPLVSEGERRAHGNRGQNADEPRVQSDDRRADGGRDDHRDAVGGVTYAHDRAAFALLRLALLSGDGKYERHALGVLRLLFPLAARHPQAFGHLLLAADFYLAPVKEVAIVGPQPEADELLRVVRDTYRPHLVLATGQADGVPLLEDREPVDGHAAAYVCQRFICKAPVTSPDDLAAAL